MHSDYPVFYVSILELTMSNSFSKRTQLALTLVIINRKPEYEISWIVDSKIDHQWTYKLLYKVIWLGYEDTEDKSKWIPTSKLTYAADLVSNFHIVYPTKLGPLSLSWSHYGTYPLPLYTSNRNYYFFSIFYLLVSFKLIFTHYLWDFFPNFWIFIFISVS